MSSSSSFDDAVGLVSRTCELAHSTVPRHLALTEQLALLARGVLAHVNEQVEREDAIKKAMATSATHVSNTNEHQNLVDEIGRLGAEAALIHAKEQAEQEGAWADDLQEKLVGRAEQLQEQHEDEWKDDVRARDEARRKQVAYATMLLEGLCAKQNYLNTEIRKAKDVEHVGEMIDGRFAAAETNGAASSDGAAEGGSDELSQLKNACAALTNALGGLNDDKTHAEVMDISQRFAQARADRKRRLQAELQTYSQDVRSARDALQRPAQLHDQRTRAEMQLNELVKLAEEVKDARQNERRAKRAYEDAEEDMAPGDVELARLKRIRDEAAKTFTNARLRSQGVYEAVVALSRVSTGAIGDDGEQDVVFPELAIRALRIMDPSKAYNQMDEQTKPRFAMENMLQRMGLLAVGRSLRDYDDSIPGALREVSQGKTHVKGAALRGVNARHTAKVLKQFDVAQFKTVKRAIATAATLKHHGVVPVECAFVERGDVWLQMPFRAGSNMRVWCKNKSREARLRAFLRIAEAVHFLHETAGVLHRDIKPENIVFDGVGDDANPSLCDFDLSAQLDETMATTMMRGTLLYLSPLDSSPSKAADMFALGMTLFDIVYCGGDEREFRYVALFVFFKTTDKSGSHIQMTIIQATTLG